MAREYHLHLISDSTGETLNTVAKAVCAQFEGSRCASIFIRWFATKDSFTGRWNISPPIRASFSSPWSTRSFVRRWKRNAEGWACLAYRSSIVPSSRLGNSSARRKHIGRADNTRWIRAISSAVEALNFAIQHDDGQNQPNLAEADVILVGVSRSSKTPTCIYLAIRGVRAGNIPIVPGVELPEHLFALKKPLFVGTLADPRSVCCRSAATG